MQQPVPIFNVKNDTTSCDLLIEPDTATCSILRRKAEKLTSFYKAYDQFLNDISVYAPENAFHKHPFNEGPFRNLLSTFTLREKEALLNDIKQSIVFLMSKLNKKDESTIPDQFVELFEKLNHYIAQKLTDLNQLNQYSCRRMTRILCEDEDTVSLQTQVRTFFSDPNNQKATVAASEVIEEPSGAGLTAVL